MSQHWDGEAHAKTTTPFEYALYGARFDVAHFLADVVNVNIYRAFVAFVVNVESKRRHLV